MTGTANLPVIRSSERVDFKRCPKKWYWNWRRGLVPRKQMFGALDLGTWKHTALEWRYTSEEKITLEDAFKRASSAAIAAAMTAQTLSQLEQEKLEKLQILGLGMARGYDRFYGDDPEIAEPIGAEIPLEFDIENEQGEVIARHALKPDLLYRNQRDEVWLLENKTAAQITLEHLPIDDQARAYATMAEISLRRQGYLRRGEHVKGVMYNFLRKRMPDTREQNAQGLYLNKNGTVSKQQPTPIYVRHPVVLSNTSKLIALRHLQREAIAITRVTAALRSKELDPGHLLKTPHKNCPKLCPFFAMCAVEEQGGDHRQMERNLYRRENPYTYQAESTDVPVSFDLA